MNLEEYIKKYPEAKKRFEFNIEVKSKVRHKIIEKFEDFSIDDQMFLERLKSEVFNNQSIYVLGSRIKGTYLTEEEFLKYSKIYTNVKRSDWDIQSLFIPDKQKLNNFQEKYNIKIDFQLGNRTIKI